MVHWLVRGGIVVRNTFLGSWVEYIIVTVKEGSCMPKISIIIPTYNHLEDCLKPCIESILKYTDMSNVEIIVAANGCNDGTQAYINNLGLRTVWHNQPFSAEYSFSTAINEAVDASSGEYIILLNNDVILMPQPKNQWINLLIEPFLKDKTVGITGPSRKLFEPIGRNFIVFFCVMISREAFYKVGKLDTIFEIATGEDVDFSIRAERAGYKVLEVYPKSFPLYHKGGTTIGHIDWGPMCLRSNRILIERYGKPKISIVIPTQNHLQDFLKPCLESIIKYTDLSNVEIIVVANGCTDDTVEWLYEQGYIGLSPNTGGKNSIKFICLNFLEAIGFTRAVNEGIKVSAGEFVVILNNDVMLLNQPVNQWLQMLLEPFKEENVGITGPMIVNCPSTHRRFVIFFCVMVRRKLFDKVGLLDEVFNPGYGEDVDFCIKAQDSGYRLAQVPSKTDAYYAYSRMSGEFPIWHRGGGTFSEKEGSGNTLVKNNLILKSRYPLKLNLGSGASRFPGYTNVDLYHDADVKADVRKLPFKNEEVVEIIAFHILEHVSPFEVSTTLLEWYRVLKPNAKLIIEMPDILQICKHFEGAGFNKQIELLNCIYGTLLIEHPHLYGWYFDLIQPEIEKAGFKNIRHLPAKEDVAKVSHWGYNFRVECTKE